MTSIYSMMVISYERTQAIVVVSSSKRFTTRTTIIAAGVIWLIAFTFCIPSLYEYSEYTSEDPETNATLYRCGSNGVSYVFTVANGVGLLLVSYIIPLITLLCNYTRILLFFRSMGMFSSQSQQRGQVFQTLYKTRMIVVKMLILVATFFIISWAPYFALLILEKISGISDSLYSDGAINMLRIALAAFSTAYNFCLYVMYNPNFRTGLLVLFGFRQALQCCSVRVSPSIDSDPTQGQPDD
ncbi:substance-P receptor-like [Pomacea canaliculata]|nr:substance-P receptor-like [Pomacea canaliculata]